MNTILFRSALVLILFCCMTDDSIAQLSSPQVLAEGASSARISHFMHIDQDSIIDMVYFRGELPSIEEGGLYQGLGYYEDGELRWNTELIATKTPRFVMLIDLDFDGKEELIASYVDEFTPCTEVYTISEGVFVPSSLGSEYFSERCLSTPTMVDINGDGRQDFYTQPSEANDDTEIAVYFRRENDTITYLKQVLKTDGVVQGVADVNQDGRLDFLVSNQLEKKLYLFMCDSLSDQYDNPIIIDSDYSMSRKRIHFIGDIDYDGDVELFYRSPTLDSLYRLDVFEEESMETAKAFLPADFGSQHWVDINLDGYVDIVFSSQILTYWNNGFGIFTLDSVAVDFPAANLVYQEQNLVSGTALLLFDQYDGLLYSNGVWNKFHYTFSEFQLRSVDDSELVDIDADGIKDLVIASRWGHSFLYFGGLGNGEYGPIEQLVREEGAYDIAFDDLNNDGITDMMFSGIWSGDLSVKYGLGTGQYSARTRLVNNNNLLRGSDLGDFDLDGYPDIVYSVLTHGKMYIIKNNEGVWSQPEVLLSSFDPESIIVRDVTADGYVDILVYGYGGNSAYALLENDQNGGFLAASIFMSAWSRNIKFVDFDADGTEEWVHGTDDNIVISKLNDGVFTIWKTIPIEQFSFNDVFVLDYNGDGYYDLVTGKSIGANQNRMYLNINNEDWVYDDEFNNLMGYSIPNIGPDDYRNIDFDQDGDIDLIYSDDENLLLIEDQRFDPSFSGTTFWDVDEDSTYTAGTDIHLSGITVDAINESEELQSFSDRNGNYRFFLDTLQYEVQGHPLNDCWHPIVTTQTQIEGNRDTSAIYDIGFWNTGTAEDDVLLARSTTPMRCLFPVKYYVTVKNNSCIPLNGPIEYIVDKKLDSIRLISLDDHALDGNTITAQNFNLQPGEEVKFHFTARGPSVEFLDELVTDTLSINYADPDNEGDSLEVLQVFTVPIRCAYDPNDKLVSPDRTDELGGTYVTDEELFYTIRFQNTGNDTAFNVYLLDTLEENLDLSSFSPVDASHPYEIALDLRTRTLRIDFRNILLPDSTTNLIGSNGFFSFRIRPVAGLSDFVKIKNSAGIYFDFNPPIITNTTSAIFVEDLSTLVSTSDPTGDSESSFTIYPNPTSGITKFSTDNVQSLELYSLEGKRVAIPINLETGLLSVEQLPAGCYLLSILLEDRSREVRRLVVVH